MNELSARQQLLAAIGDVLGQVRDHAIFLADDLEIEDPLAHMADTANHLLCETCGWLNRMVCPECPGCGCYNGRCSGWRHNEYAHEDDSEPEECGFCGVLGCPGYCNVDDYNMRGYEITPDDLAKEEA